MNTAEIVKAIDEEIERLQEAKRLLGEGGEKAPKRVGRPGKRTVSPEGRARMAAALKARWAKSGRKG